MATLGRVPAVGDTVPADGWTARVVDMDGHRVDRVRLERDEPGRRRPTTTSTPTTTHDPTRDDAEPAMPTTAARGQGLS